MLIIPGAQVEMEPEIDIGDLGKPDALDCFQKLNSFSKYWFSRTIEGDNITILDVPALHMDKRGTFLKDSQLIIVPSRDFSDSQRGQLLLQIHKIRWPTYNEHMAKGVSKGSDWEIKTIINGELAIGIYCFIILSGNILDFLL